MAKVKVRINGKTAEVEETTPGLFGRLGYGYAPSATSTPRPNVAEPSPAPSTIASTVSSSDIAPAPSVAFPEPTAPTMREQHMQGISASLEAARNNLTGLMSERKADIETRRSDYQREEQALLDDVAKQTTPFREDLEQTERERLYVNENFEANQKLVSELETLLTEGNALIEQERGLPLHQRTKGLRVASAMEKVQARAGVIEAVMNARNGQIEQAYSLIDRSVDAIAADRNDRLAYYNTLLTLNGEDQLALDAEAKELAKQEIDLAKADLDRIQGTSDYLKSLMIDPETAQFVADAGVTLTDSVEEVNAKLAEQSRRQQIAETKNELIEEGYKYVPFANGRSDVVTFDIGGQQLAFVPPAGKSGGGSGGSGGVPVGLVSLDEIGSPDDPMPDIIAATAGGRVLTQSEVKPLTDANRVLNQLGDLTTMIQTQTGPLMGIIRSNNAYDVKAQELRAAITTIVPQLARGIYGEVGVLTDSDVARYIQTLPNVRSTDDVNKALMGLTLRNIRSAFVANLEAMAAAGRDVSGFVGIYNRFNEQITDIESELGIGSSAASDEDLEAEFEQEFGSSSNEGGGVWDAVKRFLFGT